MDKPLVEVYRIQGEFNAQIIRGLLESHGIDCVLNGESLRLTHGLVVTNLGLVKILVRDSDAEAARQLLDADNLSLEPEEE